VSAARITRLRVTQARRKLISSSDSEGGGPGVVPPRLGVGLKKTKKVELVPERSVNVARQESARSGPVPVETESIEFPPLPPLPQRRRGGTGGLVRGEGWDDPPGIS